MRPVQTSAAGRCRHRGVSELLQIENAWTVVLTCRDCGCVLGWAHPRTALDLMGPDSEIGRQVLAVFPEWKASDIRAVDVLKRKLVT